MKKRIFTTAAAALILTGCGSAAGSSSYDPPEYIEPYEVVATETDFDPDAAWYKELCDGLLTYSTHVDVADKVDRNDVKAAMRQLNTDHPDIFWIGVYYVDHRKNRTNIDFEPLDGIKEEDFEPMHDELEKAADELISSMPSDLDEYHKVLYVHDYIAENCSYDHAALNAGNDMLIYTAYGALVNGKAVCQGYAEAFSYIMELLGIEAGTVQGDTYNFAGHAWNYVKVDGEYYWLDITWDDSESYPISHAYFLLNDEMQAHTRYLEWEQNFAPVCTATKDNYSVKNGLYFEEYDKDQIESAIDSCDEEACELRFADFDTYKEAIDDLIGKNRLSKLMSGACKYYRDDRNYILTVYL
ncbi:MAG: hypothetical protein IJ071_10325 [Ruminococcus sp.]|nr:hypothetical protein [Ruminococcus sp.]